MVVVSVAMTAGLVVGAELDLLPIGDPERAHAVVGAPAGALYDTRAGEVVTMEAALERMAAADVVLLGEEHTAMQQHQQQAEIVRALGAQVESMVVGLEFFLRDDAPVLAQWVAGAIDDRELLERTEWYDRGSYRFEYYEPILEAAREHGARVVGLNVDRSIPRAVSRGGLAALSEAQRDEVGTFEVTGAPQHRYLVTRYFGETAVSLPPSWLDNMYAAQCVWDVAMARSIVRDRPADGPMVVIVGSGHVAYDLGIARRLRETSSDEPLDVVTYCPVAAPARDEDGDPMGHPMGHGMAAMAPQAMFVRSLADYVAVFEPAGVPAFPGLGLKIGSDDNGAVVVERVWPGSLAEAAGFATNDQLLTVNGQPVADERELRFVLAAVRWGDRVACTVDRDGEVYQPVMLVQPDLVALEAELEPGWGLEAVEPFDPAGITAPEAVADAPESTQLISSAGVPVRVEVRDGRGLAAFHELNETGLAVRSVYRDPLPDGAVELRYQRDADGVVVTTERLGVGAEDATD